MSEHSVAIVSFEGAVKREIKRLRESLKRCEDLPQFRLDIEVSGRVLDGDIELVYKLSKGVYGTETAVSGATLDAVEEEFLRRYNWQKTNAPKALSFNAVPNPDDIPF